MTKPEIRPILIAGGRGTRFWPLSRKKKPKPLLSLLSREPMIRSVFNLLNPLSGSKKIFVATSRELASAIRKILPEMPRENFLLEPEPRDTAAAIGLSLALISRKIEPDATEPVLAFIPSDLNVKRPARFRKILESASELAAKKNLIVAIGVIPDTPNPDYGYLQPGKKIPGHPNALLVRRFHEKPRRAQALKHLKQGCLWNTGIFISRPSVLWAAFEKDQPDFYRRLRKISQAKSLRLRSTILKEFPRLKKISFDYAIMERAENLAMVKGDFGWSELGSFSRLDQILGRDRIKSLGPGRLVAVKSDRILARTEKLTVALGVRNLAIIESEDAILIMDRDHEPLLKQLVAELERLGLDRYL